MPLKNLNLKTLLIISTLLFYTIFYFKFITDKNLTNYFIKSDFKVYYVAAQLAREGKIKDIYNDTIFYSKTLQNLNLYERGSRYLRFINFPIIAYFFIPFTYLSITDSYRLYTFLVLGIMCFGLIKLQKIYGSDIGIILISIPTPIFFGGMYYGQISPFIFLILILLLISLVKKNDKISGILSGLLIIKPQVLLLIPFVFIFSKKKKKYLFYTLITLLFYLAVNILIFGSKLFVQYFNYLLSHQIETHDGYLFNFFVFYKYIDIKIILFFTIISLAFAFYLINKKFKEGYDIKVLFPLIIIFGLIFNIHTTYNDLLFLLIPLFYFYSLKNLKYKFFMLLLMALVMIFSLTSFQFYSVSVLLLIAFLSLYHIKYLA
ncbi:hypothetical protein A2V49_04790 [candidate division WWE3 bacterium RBG_19FT_COMBO_34_6]|uniref:DUF2029 domain-containing protein n=1 Tax=candidate division WWE3 bacterium RBG_19FT_COMBO_34_6 TaxID=1802612 RepID=A0A1F4UKM1_UNCKA|nr:MAG: hypothetical protein A2V49_04790 [candidate division WWE3 bacterium RBG_19FT_COMBO_34_6]